MTYARFAQLWTALVTDRIQQHPNPIMVDGCSPHTVDALVTASEGDFSAFDRADAILANRP